MTAPRNGYCLAGEELLIYSYCLDCMRRCAISDFIIIGQTNMILVAICLL
ncbi:hypothetical protein [Enterococcus silesiacus]|nr:hypothetical protein [Enterococcus silesiacus]